MSFFCFSLFHSLFYDPKLNIPCVVFQPGQIQKNQKSETIRLQQYMLQFNYQSKNIKFMALFSVILATLHALVEISNCHPVTKIMLQLKQKIYDHRLWKNTLNAA